MIVKCPYCGRDAELVTGNKIYPRLNHLHHLMYWRCDPCDAHVGCHSKGAYVPDAKRKSDGSLPLGGLANAELRAARNRAHAAFDPLWKTKSMNRKQAYSWLAGELGISIANCHIGMMNVDTCKSVVAIVAKAAGKTFPSTTHANPL